MELNEHGPNVFGWYSKKSSTSDFPKEIVLKFDFPATVVKIQVLAHQFLIRKNLFLTNNLCLIFNSISSTKNRILVEQFKKCFITNQAEL